MDRTAVLKSQWVLALGLILGAATLPASEAQQVSRSVDPAEVGQSIKALFARSGVVKVLLSGADLRARLQISTDPIYVASERLEPALASTLGGAARRGTPVVILTSTKASQGGYFADLKRLGAKVFHTSVPVSDWGLLCFSRLSVLGPLVEGQGRGGGAYESNTLARIVENSIRDAIKLARPL